MDYSQRREVLDGYLKKHNLSKEIADKIDIHSVHTNKFAYKAMRIGNNIGDPYQIAIDIVFLETIAEKYNLTLDMTDYPELHTKGIDEKDLDALVEAAKIFESRLSSLETKYDAVSEQAKNFMKNKFTELL